MMNEYQNFLLSYKNIRVNSMNEAIELAKRTWYPKDHPLHYELHHPLGKLVAEWGEFLSDYMNIIYNPEYKFNPENELIDVWYYIRILAYQANANLEAFPTPETISIERIISNAIGLSNKQFQRLCKCKENNISFVNIHINSTRPMIASNYSSLVYLCSHFNLTVDQLTEASWEKLKPGSEQGEEWMKAAKITL